MIRKLVEVAPGKWRLVRKEAASKAKGSRRLRRASPRGFGVGLELFDQPERTDPAGVQVAAADRAGAPAGGVEIGAEMIAAGAG